MKTENEESMITKCRTMCTICENKNAQIHHIDGNPKNDELNNLTLLCFDHHEKAQKDLQINHSMSIMLIPERLKKLREQHIKKWDNKSPPVKIVIEKESFTPKNIEDFFRLIKELGWTK